MAKRNKDNRPLIDIVRTVRLDAIGERVGQRPGGNIYNDGSIERKGRGALENAASIAGMFLTTECVIVEKKEDKPEMPMGAPGMGGMGGMM